MGRIRLGGLIVFFCALAVSLAQTEAAQSPVSLAKSSAKAEPDSVARPPLPRPRPTPRRPEIFFCDTPDASCRTTQDTFPLAELRDLFLFVTWPGVSGQHIQTVEFFLPDGSLYSSQKTQFKVGGGPLFVANMPVSRPHEVGPTPPAPYLMADANKVHPEGIPSLLTKSRGDSAILNVLPVAGTYITQRSLTGVWHVRVLLDDRIVAESEFTLAPRPPAPSPRAELEADR